jgi:hypothetical protein
MTFWDVAGRVTITMYDTAQLVNPSQQHSLLYVKKDDRKRPCRSYINNSNESDAIFSQDKRKDDEKYDYRPLTIRKNVETFSDNFDLVFTEAPHSYIALIHLTFRYKISHKEVSRRFNSLNSGYFNKSPYFNGRTIRVDEIPDEGQWHIHLLKTLTVDIGDETNRKKVENDLLKNLRKYKFGYITKVEVVQDKKKIKNYLSKGLKKARTKKTKGVRLVSYSRGSYWHSAKHQQLTPASKKLRQNSKAFAGFHNIHDENEMADRFGKRWAYYYAEDIMNFQPTPTIKSYKNILIWILTIRHAIHTASKIIVPVFNQLKRQQKFELNIPFKQIDHNSCPHQIFRPP